MTSDRTASAEPFVPVPLWALAKALADHRRSCGACAGRVNTECVDPWYRQGLDQWIGIAKVGRGDG